MKFYTTLIALAAMLFASSCSETIDQYTTDATEPTDSIAAPPAADSAQTHTIAMTLNAIVTDYDGTPSTRATSGDWAEGDALYLRFSTASGGVVTGTATYQAATASWALTYTGTLPNADGRLVEVVHVDGVPLSEDGLVHFNATHGAWNGSGTYTMSGGNISVTATLNPATSRIRFRGTQGQSITLTRFNYYALCGRYYGLTSTVGNVTLTVNGSYTPYVYGWIDDNHLDVFTSESSSTHAFGITFPESAGVLKSNSSGWMDLPTEQSHNGWEKMSMNTNISYIWINNSTDDKVSWDGKYRFSNDNAVTGDELYTIPMDVWNNVIKEGTFYLSFVGDDKSIVRITTGWWTGSYGDGNEFDSYKLAENDPENPGMKRIKINIKKDGSLYDIIDQQHLLFTGSDYTPMKLYYYENADDGVTQDDDVRTYNANGVSFQMVKVSGGTFTMGATPEQESNASDNDKPAHSVTLSSYYIGKYEVTQQLWQAVMGSNPSTFKGNKRPVEMVSWNDCQTFISKLNTLTGAQFRLPTEAEWEFAARGGVKSQGYKYSGSNVIDDVAWYGDNSGNSTHDVGTKSPNELGLYDMSGNVFELCSDWYGSYSSSSQTNPTGPNSGSDRVVRGGSWNFQAVSCRSSYRVVSPPDDSFYNLGLRLVLVP